jgi:ParB family chromosome partitioning protein
MGHARALIGAPNVDQLAEQVIARGLSVRETEKLARERKGGTGGGSRQYNNPRVPDADLAALEQQLSDLLGLSVRIQHGDTGGTLTLAYATLDQLDMVCQRLTGEAI